MALGWGLWSLIKKQKKRTLALLTFFLFLYFSYFFVVSIGRSTTNQIGYTWLQFRYQYMPNALVLMAVLVLLDTFSARRREIIIICCALFPILLSNFYASRIYVRILNFQLQPLKVFLNTINEEIESGKINPRNKLYIDDRVTRTLPAICWNEDMARFMRGTYQWFFNREDLACFTVRPEKAAWIIGADNHRKIRPYRPSTLLGPKPAGRDRQSPD